MTVTHPELLYGLLLLVPVIVLQFRGFFLGRRDLLRLGAHFSPDQVSSLFIVKWFLSSFAFNVFLIFVVFAASGVTWGEEPLEEDRAGLDIAFVIDVSRSMLAADLTPSRLDRAVDLVRLVSRSLPLSRISLVVFKGEGTVLLPMTDDHAAVDTILQGVGPGLVSAPGTDIEAGISVAIDRFPSASISNRAVVLISDGEALDGDAAEPVRTLRTAGIPLFAVLAGTAEGAVVPAADGTALLDPDGRPVISRADPTVLRTLAEGAGGTFVRLTDIAPAEELVDSLTRFATVRETEGFRLVPRQRYGLFLSVALVALTISIVVRSIRWRGMF